MSEENKISERGQMVYISKNICASSGHKIVVFQKIGETAEQVLCTACGATLAEIRGEK